MAAVKDRVDIDALIGADPIKGAWLSDSGVYRYALWRIWDRHLPRLPVCMLNPSTADGHRDDATIRRLIAFAKREGYGGIIVVNLFAFRATEPTSLRGRHYDLIVGPRNNAAIEAAIPEGSVVLCGWGAFDGMQRNGRGQTRSADFMGYLAHVEARPLCLGRTAGGSPRHPLYVRADQPMVAFE
ncbi:DUF1643 domain-containing protein [Devosia ginsengisoli]|uniref:DUF1643 domain-containing protein n=1 Tax=Devosia ginsengisoli TaxID=400770 RepID=UPI0026EDBED2|nr:DUF1643 domain-containing protein [Devosia ginsengisoli]MCR6673257.1 DUF1643 domain-containing protein [Devosia ginsengisoli]